MLKFKIDKNCRVTLSCSGTVADIATDCALMLGMVYNRIKRQDPERAERFKTGIQNMVNDEDAQMWTALHNSKGEPI